MINKNNKRKKEEKMSNIIPKQYQNDANILGEQENSHDYLDIWDVNPSYKDINSRFSILKGISLTIILFF